MKLGPFSGKKHSEASKEKMRYARLISPKKIRHNTPHTPEAKLKVSIGNRGKTVSEESRRKMSIAKSGTNNPSWLSDRTKLKKYDDERKDRRSSAYGTWRREVWKRDGFKCKIADSSCEGRIEAHHILAWRDHPELRYNLNNGITLCHAHHPRVRAEEKRLIPTFMELVSVSNDEIE